LLRGKFTLAEDRRRYILPAKIYRILVPPFPASIRFMV
jgi:hypothetical protein